MTAPSIELHGVSKRYWKIEERSLVRSLIPLGREGRAPLWALHDVDLQVEEGSTIGLIGRNGAGKSTLLRLLAGVSQPTSGSVVIRGRVAPLLSVGVGFHPEMTGRENIQVNAMLLGLSRREIAARFDEIVDFADLADFIDTPVKFYSSGMFMRLGFSVAIHVDPDVLILDEVLAVGDMGFQTRCFERMRALQHDGTTIVFVSHSMHAIHMLCPRTILLHRGRVQIDGSTEEAIARYHEVLATDDDEALSGRVRVVDRALLADGRPAESVFQDQTLTYRTVLRFEQPVDSPQLMFSVVAEDGVHAYGMFTTIGDGWRTFSAGEEATVEVTFRTRFGGGGTFRIATMVVDNDGKDYLLQDHNGPSFYVPPKLGVTGVADVDATIYIDGVPRTLHKPFLLDGTSPP